MKLTLSILAILAMTSAASAQVIATGNTVKAVNGPLLLQGVNSSGVPTQSVSISNVGHVDARSANFNGADGVSASKFTMPSGGTISGAGQVVTIDAVGNGNIIAKDSLRVEGNITGTQTISTSGTIQTTGTGSINSAYNLTAAGGKFTVAGDTGTVNVGSGKIVLNASNGNASVNGVALLNGGAYVGQRVEGGSLPALTVNGLTASKGIHNGGQKIAGVADGNVDAASDQAVNGSQLHETNEALALEKSERISGDAANAAGLAAEMTAREAGDTANAAAIAAETTRATDAEAVLDARKADKTALTAEATARANADTALSARIDANAAASLKASRQSGALAMAVAGMTGASPTDHGRTAVSMGVGTFGGETAIAVGVSHAVSNAVRIFGSITQVSGGDTGAAIGGSYSF
jgi:hypothetical protein